MNIFVIKIVESLLLQICVIISRQPCFEHSHRLLGACLCVHRHVLLCLDHVVLGRLVRTRERRLQRGSFLVLKSFPSLGILEVFLLARKKRKDFIIKNNVTLESRPTQNLAAR